MERPLQIKRRSDNDEPVPKQIKTNPFGSYLVEKSVIKSTLPSSIRSLKRAVVPESDEADAEISVLPSQKSSDEILQKAVKVGSRRYTEKFTIIPVDWSLRSKVVIDCSPLSAPLSVTTHGLALFASQDTLFDCTDGGALLSCALLRWVTDGTDESFDQTATCESLFGLLEAGKCPYFYAVGERTCILVRSSAEDERDAIVSDPTPVLRTAMKKSATAVTRDCFRFAPSVFAEFRSLFFNVQSSHHFSLYSPVAFLNSSLRAASVENLGMVAKSDSRKSAQMFRIDGPLLPDNVFALTRALQCCTSDPAHLTFYPHLRSNSFNLTPASLQSRFQGELLNGVMSRCTVTTEGVTCSGEYNIKE